MTRTNIEKYNMSMAPIKSMLKNKILTKSEYLKAENHIANKYCINKDNLYRLNDLTNKHY